MVITKPKVIDLQKLEFGTCFFCDKLVIISDVHCSREDFENLQKLLGIIPERLGGKIGNKIICKSCKGDIWAMAQD